MTRSAIGPQAVALLARSGQAGDRRILFVAETDGAAVAIRAFLSGAAPDRTWRCLPLHDCDPTDTDGPCPAVAERRVDLLTQWAAAEVDAVIAAPEAMVRRMTQAKEGSEDPCPWPDLPPDALTLATGAAMARMERLVSEGTGDPRYLSAEDWAALKPEIEILDIPAHDPAPRPHLMPDPRKALTGIVDETPRTLVVCATERDRVRVTGLLRRSAQVETPATWAEAMESTAPATLIAPLDRGFRMKDRLVLAARDILGHDVDRPGEEGGSTTLFGEIQDLHFGDLMVHEDHGLCRFDGLDTVEDAEMLRLAFAEDKALLVPVLEAGRLWRHGHDEGDVTLDHLGGSQWKTHRATLARRMTRTARKLVRTAADRTARTVPKLTPEGAGYARVAREFAWDETPDQATAIAAVLHDLASGRPMDRLLIGDVGFGKTEVAIRAIAVAACAGVQVALIAPTTVLVRQHAQTLARRLAAADIEVASLSRLTGRPEARRVRAGLEDGTVRVVVGTHALLSRSTRFADLGLIVVDEEQRFGSTHKRTLRRLSRGVHVLSMTATPIPASLQEAMIGVQDMSVIATAPRDRAPVRTRQAPMDPDLLAEVLQRERTRGGRSFVIVPRIEDIATAEAMIAGHLPDLRVRIAHGDLSAADLDAAMTKFAQGDGDVLLATAIVESGLDIARADTMVILRPDRFGLAQLHQLRGRVGRGRRRAQCLLLTDPAEDLSPAAARRLDTLTQMSGPGAGFRLAQVDLDRRGGGDPSEDGQSGHAAHIGPALHADLLDAALRREKGEPYRSRPDIRIDADAALPGDYIEQPEARATLYNRLGHVRTLDDVEALAAEIADRFGPAPPAVDRLLRVARLRAVASERGITALSAGPEAVAVDMPKGVRPDDLPRGARRVGSRIVLRGDLCDAEARLSAAFALIDGLDP